MIFLGDLNTYTATTPLVAAAMLLCLGWFVVGAGAALSGRPRLLKPLASLKFTVVLFALGLVLIFVGTLAQVDRGIWTVLRDYFRAWVAQVELQGFVRFGQVFFHVSPDARTDLVLPFPGGYTIGSLMLLNLLAAHLIRFKLSWKRAGIVVMHVGVVLMLVGEFITSAAAHESNMSIDLGQTVRHSEDTRAVELAVIDPSDARTDHVVVVSQRLLERGGFISGDALPFDIRIDQYMANSEVVPVTQMQANGMTWPNPATAGDGLRFAAREIPPFSGTMAAERVEAPAAYVTLFVKPGDGREATPIGSYLLALQFATRDMRQRVELDGKQYDLSLRWERTYYPFAMTLTDFNHGYYPGTSIPNNFESQLRLVNAATGDDREVRVFMNNPLRYDGLTFYQSQFKRGGSGTVLQVVRNPGWLLPYVSCAAVAIGLLWHLLFNLAQFGRRAAA